MKLRIMTPTELTLELEAAHVTVEDMSGSLGIRPHHTSLVTALVPGIVAVRGTGGEDKYAAVNGGVLVVHGGDVDIVSREAVVSNDPARLDSEVVAGFEREEAADRTNHVAFEKMRIRLMKSVLDFDRADL
jgi:F-type H+-transporting ATPase subunit epsilon